MSNTITIELCKEDRQRIDELIAFAGLIASEMKSRTLTVVEDNEPEAAAPAEEHPVDDDLPWETSEPAAEPEQPKYTTADILAKVQTMAGPGNPKRERAKAIVQSYGKKVSDIPEDKRAEAMQRLIELEAEV